MKQRYAKKIPISKYIHYIYCNRNVLTQKPRICIFIDDQKAIKIINKIFKSKTYSKEWRP